MPAGALVWRQGDWPMPHRAYVFLEDRKSKEAADQIHKETEIRNTKHETHENQQSENIEKT